MKPIKARTFWDNIGSLLGNPHFHTYMSFDGELTTPSLRHRFSEMSVRPTLAISGKIATNSTELSTKFAVIYKIVCQAKIKNIVHEFSFGFVSFIFKIYSDGGNDVVEWLILDDRQLRKFRALSHVLSSHNIYHVRPKQL